MIITDETKQQIKTIATEPTTHFAYTEHNGRGQTDYINLYMLYIKDGKIATWCLNPFFDYSEKKAGVAVPGYARTRIGEVLEALGIPKHTYVERIY